MFKVHYGKIKCLHFDREAWGT